ncbi:MAG: S-methyl-5-thioribose-1-phosphate isomerase [Methanomicrobiales archaeon]|nr:S-methyl-5-thioribose-1-phosphate isomerase [Methanomicrobiales archaeon]NYT21077.1 S-methyl-5-thioribose-1-phosphate isomerase [Methanomicrobiales archaeon]
MKAIETIRWDDDTSSIVLIDQTMLPLSYRVVRCRTVDRLITAIRRLEVRGAPALGVAGAYGAALAAGTVKEKEFPRYLEKVETAARAIAHARPTAVNLSWGVQRVLSRINRSGSIAEARLLSLKEAHRVAEEDSRSCHAIGDHGSTLIADGSTVLTHCNAGALACREWGTALGIIRSAIESGKEVKVIACETRPLLQGARLTAWELKRDNIGVTVIPDSAAASLMRSGGIDCVVVGADRITHDAVFNKVGTYMHAICARAHSLPFYVAAPLSTFDPVHGSSEIVIEERDRDEVAFYGGHATVPEGVPVRNPAFDATPLELVSAIVSESGVHRPPLDWDEIARTRRVI